MGLLVGSKPSLCALLATDAGVFIAPGVRDQAPCAGLGVTLMKSAKSKAWEGVCGPPNPESRPVPPPGVVIIEEGRARGFEGGVWGGCMRLRG